MSQGREIDIKRKKRQTVKELEWVCVCVRERETEREREREREREKERERRSIETTPMKRFHPGKNCNVIFSTFSFLENLQQKYFLTSFDALLKTWCQAKILQLKSRYSNKPWIPYQAWRIQMVKGCLIFFKILGPCRSTSVRLLPLLS